MRLASWNVNGLRAIAKKGCFLEWIEDFDPDVLLVQETKARADDLPQDIREIPGFHSQFHSATKKGYSGVAIYSRFEVDEWTFGLGDDDYDCEGRVLSARFADIVVTSAYFPNSQAEGKRLPYKLGFCAAFERFLESQREMGRHVVVGGDYNVAHEPIDLARPESNTTSPGYLPEERAWYGSFLDKGYVDSWRRQNKDVKDVYSWWSMRTRARERNIGWHIDCFCVDAEFWPFVKHTDILMSVAGSDHCPVVIDIKNPN